MEIYGRIYKVDPKEFIDELGKKFHFNGLDDQKVKGQYFLKCPFHKRGEERTASANFSLIDRGKAKQGDFMCFGCGVKGHISSILTRLFGEKRLAQEWVETKYGDKRGLGEETREVRRIEISLQKKEEEKPQVFELDERAYYNETSYYESRGIPDELVKRFKLGYLDSKYPEKRKVYLPVFNKEGQVVFFQTRNIHDKKFYLPVGAKKVLWGADQVTGPEVVVCESIFNSLTAWKNGFQSVALFGTGDDHTIQQLLELPCRSYILCLDPDEAGRKGTQHLLSILKENNRLVSTVSIGEKGKDLNDFAKLSHEEFMEKWNLWLKRGG